MLQIFVSIQNRLAMLRDERGQTMAEYGVVLAVITLIVVVALTTLSGAIKGALEEVAGLFS
jgi:Flp pilus assembly pilin Flp